MAEPRSLKRVAYSPKEFAELFGKSQTWGYRQIYSGKVTAITQHGRTLIPAKEVEKVLESAGIYDGRETGRKEKAPRKDLTPVQKTIWQRFLDSRRIPSGGKKPASNSSFLPAHLRGKWANSFPVATRGRIAKGWKE